MYSPLSNSSTYTGDVTAGFLIHGQRAWLFGQIFDQIFGQVFDQGFWPGFLDQKIQCAVLYGRKNTALQYYRDGENLGENHVTKKPIFLNIPYIKSLAVRSNVNSR